MKNGESKLAKPVKQEPESIRSKGRFLDDPLAIRLVEELTANQAKMDELSRQTKQLAENLITHFAANHPYYISINWKRVYRDLGMIDRSKIGR